MTNELAQQTHKLVSGYEDQIKYKYWAAFLPVFEWAHVNGMKATDLAKDIGIPIITIYKVIDALNVGENIGCREHSYLRLVKYADRKNIQL
jgi:hypothetical protein